ncbi:hypothetical protein D3C81_1883120 [compost metagenome]
MLSILRAGMNRQQFTCRDYSRLHPRWFEGDRVRLERNDNYLERLYGTGNDVDKHIRQRICPERFCIKLASATITRHSVSGAI